MLSALFVFLSLNVILHESCGEKIIINTDAGGDDAFAILMLLRYEKSQPKASALEVIGIVCTYGNTNLENVEQNVLKTLTVAGRDDIPVYGGAERGYVEKFSTNYYWGNDGFGDFAFNRSIGARVDRSKHGVIALIDMARENAGNVTILSLGPTTNIALAIALDSNFTRNVKQFYVMGGCVSGKGNPRPSVEFNFAGDPESNLVLFEAAAEAQITLFPWETFLKNTVSKEWRLNVLGNYDSPYMRFLNKAESATYGVLRNTWESADTLMTACVIEKSLVQSYIVRNVDPVTDGKARGSVLVDYKKATDKVKNSQIVKSINTTLYRETLIKYLTCEQIPCDSDYY